MPTFTKKIVLLTIVGVLVCGLLVMHHFLKPPAEKRINKAIHFSSRLFPRNRYDLTLNRKRFYQARHFVTKHMSGSFGVYTNWNDSGQNQAQATGHEVLSESYGLLLESDVLKGDENAFHKHMYQLNQILRLSSGWSYRYSPKQRKKYRVNASVDDLRILLALKMAAHRFNNVYYSNMEKKYGRIFVTTMIHNDKLYNFYDLSTKQTDRSIMLCYIRLRAINELPINESSKSKLINHLYAIIKRGFLTPNLPFYQQSYNYTTNNYVSGSSINTTESLLTIFNLSEMDLQRAASIAFLKKQVAAGHLDNAYYPDGAIADTNQSAANYAIAAMIAANIGDQSFYRLCITKMNHFQVTNGSSSFLGGFGYIQGKAFYSFNNLMAMLAYQY